jgi:hypothetical protein
MGSIENLLKCVEYFTVECMEQTYLHSGMHGANNTISSFTVSLLVSDF